ncbi:MAG: class I SAM-dependent methyltransferase [Sandaracinus sp.]
MSVRSLGLDDSLHAYLLASTLRDHPVLHALREETARMTQARMQISPEQGQLMQLLVELTGARRIIEVGTFTGYSSTAMALALPADGKIVCCDVSEAFTAVARRAWKAAGVEAKIDLRIAPATETMDGLLASGQEGTYDLVFIDADKAHYDAYYERALRLLRVGGLVLLDNVLWSGRVADPSVTDADTAALRTLNGKIHADPRVTQAMLPIGDGLTLARKRG